MIRIRLAEPQYREAMASFLGLAGLEVTCVDDDDETFWVDFSRFDLNEDAQLRIVERMLEAWAQERENGALTGARIEVGR